MAGLLLLLLSLQSSGKHSQIMALSSSANDKIPLPLTSQSSNRSRATCLEEEYGREILEKVAAVVLVAVFFFDAEEGVDFVVANDFVVSVVALFVFGFAFFVVGVAVVVVVGVVVLGLLLRNAKGLVLEVVLVFVVVEEEDDDTSPIARTADGLKIGLCVALRRFTAHEAVSALYKRSKTEDDMVF
jgi:hypothetical protein